MKTKFNPYLKLALKRNLVYLIILLFLIPASIFLPIFFFGQYNRNRLQVEELEKEIVELETKRSVLTSIQNNQSENLEEDVILLSRLIPDIEDYFSIIFALEELSQKTDFQVTSYKIDLERSTSNKLAVTIGGSGDQESFLRFLSEFNVGGGRLITAEKIEINQDKSGDINLSLNFYNKRVSDTSEKDLDFTNALTKANAIKQKVSFSLGGEASTSQVPLPQNYPIDANPF